MCFSRRRRTPGTPPRRLHGIRRRARTAADRCGEGGALKPLWLRAVVGSRVSRALLAVSMSRLSRFKSLVPLHLTHGSNPVSSEPHSVANVRPNLAGSAGASPRGEGRVRQGDRRPPSRPSRHVPHGRREVRVPRSTWTVVGGGPSAALSTSSWTQHAPRVRGGGSRAETEPVAQPRSAGARERPRHAKAHSGRHGDRARRLLLHRHRVRHLGQRDLRLHALRCSASGARVLTRSRASSRLT